MKAIVFEGKGQLAYKDVETPRPGKGEVQIKIAYAGICGSDLSIVHGVHPRAKAPLVMGHEFSGTISELGEGVSGLSLGDRVTAEPLISCGECYSCKMGYSYVCEKLGLWGIDAPGAFADYMIIPAEKIYSLPPGISLQAGAMVEPLAVGVHAVRLSSLQVGDQAVVLGAGPIGLVTALAARESGAQVFISEVEPFRIKRARSLGFDVIDGSENVEEAIMTRTLGRGCRVVFECAGAPPTIMIAPKLACVRGEVIQVAMPKTPQAVDIVAHTFKEITMKGVRVYAPFDFEKAVNLAASGKIDLDKILSPPYKPQDHGKAIADAEEGKESMRVMFELAGGK
jgi:(R,R)-butanediol dehydrogenase/meso-butanediol dehydrogenase/diacetyl reductase